MGNCCESGSRKDTDNSRSQIIGAQYEHLLKELKYNFKACDTNHD